MLRAVVEVRVRIVAAGEDDAGRLGHFLRDISVQIEFGSDEDVGTDDSPRPRQQIALAIVIALRHLRAVHEQEHQVHRPGGLEIVQYFVAQGLVVRLHAGRARFGESEQRGRNIVSAVLREPEKPAIADEVIGFRRVCPFFGRWKIPCSKERRVVGIGENELVSCIRPAMKTRRVDPATFSSRMTLARHLN